MNNIVLQLLDRNVESSPQKVAIKNNEGAWTYQQLFQRVSDYASYVESLGLKIGAKIAIIQHDSFDAVAAFLAIIRQGFVACIINPDLDDIDWRLEHCGVEEVIPSRVSESSETPSMHLGDHKRPAFILFTSGTTGHPQAVIHRHRDIQIMNKNYGEKVLGITKDDVFYSSSKMFFAYGLNSILFALYQGATVELAMQEPTMNQLWNNLSKKGVTIFFGVPTVFGSMLCADDIPDKLTLRHCVSAGEKLPQWIFDEWLSRFNSQIIDGIGTTEILSTFVSNLPNKCVSGAAGKVVPGFEVKLVPYSDEYFVLWVRGDTYHPAYLNNTKATKDRFVDGWFVTNDLFTKDSDDYYYHGRVSDLINNNGRYASPYKVEELVLMLEGVADCALVDRDGLSLYVVAKGRGCSVLKNDILSIIADHSGLIAPEIYFVDNIPSTPAGKKKRYLLSRAT